MDSPPPVVGPAPLPSSLEADLPRPLKKFYRGEPLALGITQIFTGITGIVFGLLIHLIDDFWLPYNIIRIAYWSGILYIISGSLAVAAARNPKMSLVQGMLAMNVISAVTAGIGIICLPLSFEFFRYYRSSYACAELHNETQKKWCYETQAHPFVSMGPSRIHL
ncbi:membrane-spanning 4-domains subfamily A member 15-like [Candoia aspera]|uniref:membrane-spanning 4-domains subfamily A member 15-like n=1 Tax=Candoia aspera TaxID=51853 RepID=UPI002FD80CE7